MTYPALALTTVLLACCTHSLAAEEPVPSAVFTTTQAEAGRAAYERSCGQCHTYSVRGRSGKEDELPPLESLPEPYQKFIGPKKLVPPLVGKNFVDRHGQKTLGELYIFFRGAARSTPAAELKMSDEMLVDITAYLLQKNGARAGGQPLTAQSKVRFDSVANPPAE